MGRRHSKRDCGRASDGEVRTTCAGKVKKKNESGQMEGYKEAGPG